MLGRTLRAELSEFEVIPTDLPEADITDEHGINEVIRDCAPDAVIHCAAMTAVDKCETERDLAYSLNALGSANVASACCRNGIRLIAISTDYVFDGASDRPYTEFDHAGGGHTVYGRSKFAAANFRCYFLTLLRFLQPAFPGKSVRRIPDSTRCSI